MLRRLRPPAGRAVPSRRVGSRILLDVGVRPVAGDGRGPPSTTLLRSSHNSTLTTLHPPPAASPSVGLVRSFQGADLHQPAAYTTCHPGTPAKLCSNTADRSARPPGAREVPPQHHHLPRQQQELERNNFDKLGRSAMLPLDQLKMEKVTLGAAEQVDALGTRARQLQSALAGKPKTDGCCSGAVKHQRLLPGGFFVTTGSYIAGSPISLSSRLRRDSHSNMLKMSSSSNRPFGTCPSATKKAIDLLVVNEETTSSEVQAAIEKLERRKIEIIIADELKEAIKQDIEELKKHQNIAKLKELYNEKIRPALVTRGLISPFCLSDVKGAELHNRYKRFDVDEVKYLTSKDLMVELSEMSELYWGYFLDFLSEQKCLIIEDWEHSFGASVGITFYKRSVTFDGSPVYRGECDASFTKLHKSDLYGTTMMCSAIWGSNCELVSCIVVKDYICSESIEAEGVGMYILLKNGYSLKLNEDPFEACIDCDLIFKTVWGSYRITKDNKNAELLKLLRYLRRDYKCLIPQWEMREKMIWVDGVTRAMRLQGKGTYKVDLRYLRSIMKRYFSGEPIFKFTQNSKEIDSFFVAIKNEDNVNRKAKGAKKTNEEDAKMEKDALGKLRYKLDLHQSCYLKVQDKNKVDALSHIITALRPSRVFIAMSQSQSIYKDEIFKSFHDCSIETEEAGEKYSISISVNHRSKFTTAEKHLWIIFDSFVPPEWFEKNNNAFTVFLRTPSDPEVQSTLKELSPLSYVSFREGPKIHALKKERSPHPSTRWTQHSGFVFIVIEAPAAKDIKCILSPDGHFKFCAMGDDDLSYELDLELFDAINLEESKLTVGPRHITYLIKMADPKWWKRLLKEEGKPPAFLKIDSKLDIRSAIADARNNRDNEVKATNKDMGGGKAEKCKGEETTTSAAEKP